MTIPNAPNMIYAYLLSSTSVSIYYSPNNDNDIDYYSAISIPDNIIGKVSSSKDKYIIINNLKPGKTYTFIVTATNRNGTSNPSNYSNYITTPIFIKAKHASIFSPQLIYNINKKKYYINLIKNNNEVSINNKYTPMYFETSYDRIYEPNISSVPY